MSALFFFEILLEANQVHIRPLNKPDFLEPKLLGQTQIESIFLGD